MSENQNYYDIVVIGAGCGGLTAAACAAKQGKKVLLLERHNTPGGFNTSFVRGRFEFEVSLNKLCDFKNNAERVELRQIFDEIEISNKLDVREIPQAYRLISKSSDGNIIDVTMPFGVDNFINAMESYVPESKKAMSKLFSVAEDIKNGFDLLSNPDIKEIKKNIKDNPNFIRTAPYSVNEVLEAIGVPLKAREIFNALWFDFGIDCDRMSFVHYVHSFHSYIENGAVVPLLRSHALSMALAGAVEDFGGEIRYNAHVSRIAFKDGKSSGVILKNGDRIKANHIICNCSPTTAYSKMIKKSDVPVTAVKRSNARKYGAKSACVYLGLNRSPKELGISDYSVIITESADTVSQFSLMKSIDTNNALKAVCLNIVNPQCSPENTTILCLSTIYTDNCWEKISPENYFDEKDMLAARLIAKYEEATGIIIHNSIEELEVATPITFARYTATPQGTTHGYFADDWDSIIARVMTEATDSDTPGLRFCGGWGTQLSGIVGAVTSGRNIAYATLADIADERSEKDEK